MKNTHFISYVIKLIVLLFVTITLVVGNMALPVFSFAETEPSDGPALEATTDSSEEDVQDQDKNDSQDTEEVSGNEQQGQVEETEQDSVVPEEGNKENVLRAPLRAPAQQYSVWFDGTLGLGTTNSLVAGATNVRSYTNNNGTITLPSSAGNNNKYKLNGWYDVRTKQWYAPGTSVTVSQDTVFYADWILISYDLQQNGTLANGQADTTSFVHTDVFDYNELFNTAHGASLNTIQVGNTHNENWRDQGGDSFLFMNWYNQNVAGYGSLGAPSNLTLGRNAYNDSVGHMVTSGIISTQNDQLVKDLFDPEDGLGKKYLGTGDNLFLHDETGSTESRGFGKGYYYYDSDYHGADYNQSAGRFYVYNNRQYIQGENSGFGGWVNGTRRPGFMPFEQGEVREKRGQTDYWFGMKTSIDFFLPDDVGSNGGDCNKSAEKKDMRFYFSGDDDVWVFVDDQLVLDLGGIHQRSAGDINFSTGEIKYYNVRDNGTETLLKTDTTTLKSITSGNHKLTIYYLERGSSWSNCSIYFNLAPRYELKLVKSDADQPSTLLPDAEFSIYRDKACTVPAMLYDNKECEGTPKSVFKTNSEGIIECYGLTANQTYYLKETSSPAAYPSVSDKIITLKLDSTGNATLVDTDDAFASVTQQGATRIDLKVSNKKPEKTLVHVEKKWYNEDGTPLTENMPDVIKVQLYRSEIETVPSGGGTTGASIPVNITTQYFGGGNGSNTDTAALTKGDLSKSLIVVSGGKLHLDLDITNSRQAGIYSVMVNGHEISPTSVSGRATQECFIGGRWGQYPPLHTTYDIENITSETDIRITLIGYLNYPQNSSVPSVAATLSVGTVVTAPEQPEPGVEPEIPSVRPEDAEKVNGEIELTEGNQWQYTWDNLDVTSPDGKTYYYYVEELPVEGYSTSYTGNGTVGGTVTVTNVRLREIIVKKLWKNAAGSDMTEGMPDSIQAALIQSDKTTNQSKEIAFTLNQGNQWTKRWRSDDSALGEQKDHVYEYRVKELDSLEGYEAPVYTNNDGISEGTITITNKKILYRLPDAGGSGTYLFVFLGSFMIVLALALIGKGRKTRRGRGRMALKTLAVLALSVSLMPQGVFAASPVNDVPDIDTSTPRSLTVEYTYGGTPIRDTEFLLCKIADLSVKDRSAKYTFTGDFSSEGGFPNDLSARESGSLAKRLYSMVLSGTAQTISGKTDSSGRLVFSDLSPGMYLIAQTAEKNLSGKRYSSDPFLASVPQPVTNEATGQTEWRYAVTVSPKAAGVKNSEKPKKPDTPKKDTPNNIKTGDPSNLRFYGVLLILSAAALSLLIIFYRRRRGS